MKDTHVKEESAVWGHFHVSTEYAKRLVWLWVKIAPTHPVGCHWCVTPRAIAVWNDQFVVKTAQQHCPVGWDSIVWKVCVWNNSPEMWVRSVVIALACCHLSVEPTPIHASGLHPLIQSLKGGAQPLMIVLMTVNVSVIGELGQGIVPSKKHHQVTPLFFITSLFFIHFLVFHCSHFIHFFLSM